MKKIMLFIGTIVFWFGWPVLWIYFRNSRRTRLLLICGDEFLALRGWIGAGNWVLTGGGFHRGENSLDGLIREVREETGITITNKQPRLLFTETYHEYGLSFDYDCYMVQLAEKPKINVQRFEIADYSWQSMNSPTVKLGADGKEALRQWLSKS